MLIAQPEAQPCESYEGDGAEPCLTCGFDPHEPNDTQVGAFCFVADRWIATKGEA